MKLELTQRARIALDHLTQPDQKHVQKLISLLADFPHGPALKGKVQKLKSIAAPDTYIAKVDANYRVLFSLSGETLSILEIAHHARLDSFLRSLRAGS